jgi:uncharacterized membrane protein YjjB (DUF3815 family)
MPWVGILLSLFFGFAMVEGNNPLGFIGFIPIVVYIFIKILYTINFDYDTIKKAKGIFLSAIGSAMTYVVTHTAFDFGIAEASISAIIAAFILGILGFTA